MAYHGYIPLINTYLSYFESPTVLEIGIDKGQTLFPVVNYLSRICTTRKVSDAATPNINFLYTGIDVLIRDHVHIAAQYINQELHDIPTALDKQDEVTGYVDLWPENSLEALPKLIERNKKTSLQYALILIDGDHNYHTVSQELKYALELVNPHGIIICDDYGGPGGEQDEFFSAAENFYEEDNANIKTLLKEEEVAKPDRPGVRGAVDEFLEENSDWQKIKFFSADPPVILFRKESYGMVNHAAEKMHKQLNLLYDIGGENE